MKRPRPSLVIALVLAAFATVVARTTVEGEIRLARGRHAAGPPAGTPTIRRIGTEEGFRAALREERAVLFLTNRLSVCSKLSERVVGAWVRESRPTLPLFRGEPYEQPYVHRWMAEELGEGKTGYYARHGIVVWLRRGRMTACVQNYDGLPADRLRVRLEAAGREW